MPPPPAPPPPPLLEGNVSNDQSMSSRPESYTNTNDNSALDNESVKPDKKPEETILHPHELRHLSKQWSLAGDAGLLLYLQDFSQRIISKTTEIEKLVENLGGSTKGSSTKVHNTFNEFLMLSSNQFIENRVYDEEITDDKSDKEATEKKDKSREEMESEILNRYADAVRCGLKVLDDAFITVEIKTAEDDSEDEEDDRPSSQAFDPIIEPKDVYSSRPLPYLIGTAEFFHDDTLGLIELKSDDEGDQKANEEESQDESDETEEESEEEETTSDDESESSEVEDEVHIKKKSFIEEESDESDGGLFDTPKDKKKKIVESDSEESEDEVKQPKSKVDLQSELASKLGLGRPPPRKKTVHSDSESDTWDTDSIKTADTQSITPTKPKKQPDTQSITSKKSRKSLKKASKQKDSLRAETASIASSRSRTKTNESRRSAKKTKKKKKKVEPEDEEDGDLFGPPKKDDFFDEVEDKIPFSKPGGLFSSTSNSGNKLFDEQDEEEDLFGDSSKETSRKSTVDKTKEEDNPPALVRTTSSGKKLPAGAVSIFGGDMFGSPQKTNRRSASQTSVASIKKTPAVVAGLFDDDEKDEDMFADSSKPEVTSPQRKRTLELSDDKESDDDDLFGSSSTKEAAKKEQPKKKIPVGGVSMFGGAPPQLQKKKENKSEVFSTGDEDDLFASPKEKTSTPSQPTKVAIETNKQKHNVISLFDDDEEEEAEDDDIFAGLTKIKSSSSKPATTSGVTPSKKVTSKALGLFDEEEDDLFATPVHTPKITPTHTPKDTPTATPKSRSPVVTKKQTSAPSLFDEEDDDLFGTKHNQSLKATTKINLVPDSVKKSEKLKSPVVVKKPTSATPSLFDDDDDLFSSKPPQKKEAATKPPQNKEAAKVNSMLAPTASDGEPISKSPVVAKKKTAMPSLAKKTTTMPSLFDDNDDLFSIQPSAKKEIVKANDNPPPKLITKNNKPKLADPFADDSSEDDLFSTKKSTTKPIDIIQDRTETSNTTSNTDTSDIFGPLESKPSDESPKPKKPIGGVSMFGGIDPLAARNKLKGNNIDKSSLPETDSTDGTFSNSSKIDKPQLAERTKPEPPSTIIREAPAEIVNREASPPPASNIKVEGSTIKVEGSPMKVGSIGKVQGLLNFNPAALLPGGVPPKRTEAPPDISFDQPPLAKTLDTATKSRAKGQAKRRPPTRKVRSTDNSLDTTDGTQKVPNTTDVPNVEKNPLVTAASSDADIFSNKIIDNDKSDLSFTESSASKTQIDSSSKPIKVADIFDDSDDDIFSSTKTKTTKSVLQNNTDLSINKNTSSSSVKSSEKENDKLFTSQDVFDDKDDLFDIPTKTSNNVDDLFSTAPKKQTATNNDNNKKNKVESLSDSEDLFNIESTSIKSKPSKATDNTNDLFSKPALTAENTESKNSTLLGSDDLFGTSKSQNNKNNTKGDSNPIADKQEDVPSSKKVSPSDIFDSDDDLFAVKPSKKKPEEITKIKVKNEKAVLDEDDLFSSPTKKVEVKKSVKQVSKKQTDNDLFGDSGSIFDDVATTTKEKKKKKKKNETEDIFATTAATDDIFAKPKKTKTKKKQTEAPKVSTPASSIFDDNSTNIFDDPLNALGGD